MTELNKKFVTILTPKDFSTSVPYELVRHRCSIVLFYTGWCPHCSDTKPVWNMLGERAAFFDVCAYDCEKYPEHFDALRKAKPDHVQGYPTIWIYENGKPLNEFQGARDVGSLVKACMDSCST